MGFCPPYTAPSDIGNVYVCTYATRPTGASLYEGRVIFETDTNTLAVYVDGAWQQIPQGTDGFRSGLINGSFDIWQRASALTANNSFTYGLDQWLQVAYTASSSLTVNRYEHVDMAIAQASNTRYYAKVSWVGGAGGGDYVYWFSRVEDVRKFAGQVVTLSWYAKIGTGTPKFGIEIEQYFGTGGSPSAKLQVQLGLYTCTAGVTRHSATFTMPSLVGKTVGTTDPGFIGIHFWCSSGATYNARGSGVGVNTGSANVWGVQLEKGSCPSPFERRPYATELILCQRYFQRIGGSGQRLGSGVCWSPNDCVFTIPFKVSLRASPSSISIAGAMTDWSVLTVANTTPTTMAYQDAHKDNMLLTVNKVAAFPAAGGAVLKCLNGQAYVDVSAEL